MQIPESKDNTIYRIPTYTTVIVNRSYFDIYLNTNNFSH